MIVSCDGAVAAALTAAHGQPFRGAETWEALVTAETVQNTLVIHFMLNLRKQRKKKNVKTGMQATYCCPVLLSKFTYKHQTLVVTYTPNLYAQKSLYSDDIQYTIAPTTVKRNCYSLPQHPLVMYFNSCGNTPVIVQMNTKGIKKLPFSNSSKRYSGTDTCWEHITEMGLWFNFPGEICNEFLLEHSAFPSDWNKTPKYRPLVDKILPASESKPD